MPGTPEALPSTSTNLAPPADSITPIDETSNKSANQSRINGAKSAGPKTAAGREKISWNTLRHGFRSHRDVIHGESQQTYDELAATYHHFFQPLNLVERQLVATAVSARWRVRRAQMIESCSFNITMARSEADWDDEFEALATEYRHTLAFHGSLHTTDQSLNLEAVARWEERFENRWRRNVLTLKHLRGKQRPFPLEDLLAAEAKLPNNRGEFPPSLIGSDDNEDFDPDESVIAADTPPPSDTTAIAHDTEAITFDPSEASAAIIDLDNNSAAQTPVPSSDPFTTQQPDPPAPAIETPAIHPPSAEPVPQPSAITGNQPKPSPDFPVNDQKCTPNPQPFDPAATIKSTPPANKFLEDFCDRFSRNLHLRRGPMNFVLALAVCASILRSPANRPAVSPDPALSAAGSIHQPTSRSSSKGYVHDQRQPSPLGTTRPPTQGQSPPVLTGKLGHSDAQRAIPRCQTDPHAHAQA